MENGNNNRHPATLADLLHQVAEWEARCNELTDREEHGHYVHPDEYAASDDDAVTLLRQLYAELKY